MNRYLVQFIGAKDELIECLTIEPDVDDENQDLDWNDALERLAAEILPEDIVRIEIDLEVAP